MSGAGVASGRNLRMLHHGNKKNRDWTADNLLCVKNMPMHYEFHLTDSATNRKDKEIRNIHEETK